MVTLLNQLKPFIRFFSLYLLFFFVFSPVYVYAQSIDEIGGLVRQTQNQPNLGTKTNGNDEIPSLKSTPDIRNTKVKNPLQNQFNPLEQKIKIHILGEVQGPGIFNVSISDRLTDVLDKAGLKRSSQRIVQLRHPGEPTQNFDLYRYFYQGDLSQNPFLRDNDVIFVPLSKGTVRIEGPVAIPGLYETVNEKTISDIIALAGGTTSAASKTYPVKVIRFSDAGEKSVLETDNSSRALKTFRINKGDIIIIPDIVNNPKNFDYSVESIPGENLFYPTATPSVFVVGSVTQAGPFPYKSNLKVKDYISYASPTPTARIGHVKLVRGGKSMRAGFDDKPIPGDMLVVKNRVSVGTVVASVSTGLSLILTTLLLNSQLKDL